MEKDKAKIIESIAYVTRYAKLLSYKPYGHPATLCPDGEIWKARHEKGEWCEWSNKPWQLEFHAAGARYQQRMILAGNRPGKTWCAAAEVAIHMTGLYPQWWSGKRFDRAVDVWTGSPTNETSRDIIQRALIGGTDSESIGTGMIPRDHIYGRPKVRQAGVSDVVDQFAVRHVSGGVSKCFLKSYEQGWRKFQGTAPDIIWMDEEPDDSEERQRRIYSEALTRLMTSRGLMMITFTPLLGMTQLVQQFMEGGPGKWMVTATWDDAPHLDAKAREEMMASYPDHERQARAFGIPMMGEGKAFAVPEDDIIVDDFQVPDYWARIKGIDFGIDHPCAVADVAWDRDNDVIYLIRSWKKKTTVDEHAEAIRFPDPWVPVAWPHDGSNALKDGSGVRLKDIYVQKGLRMLARSACYSSDKLGAQPIEPIVAEINDRASDGRFRVFKSCKPFLEEYRSFHRKDGKLVARNDDALKACFYAVMMRRFAATPPYRKMYRHGMPVGLTTAV